MAAVLEVEVGGPVERDVEEVAGGRGLRGSVRAGDPGEGKGRGVWRGGGRRREGLGLWRGGWGGGLGVGARWRVCTEGL